MMAGNATLNAALLNVVRDLQPGNDELTTKSQALERVRQMLLERWPEGTLHVFGSMANALSWQQ